MRAFFLNLHAKRALYHSVLLNLGVVVSVLYCFVFPFKTLRTELHPLVFHCYPKALIFSIYINKYLNERGLLGLFHSQDYKKV